MNRKRKLRYYKRLRKWRDEILMCENMGRIRHLIFEHPEVQKVTTHESMMAEIEIRLHSGFEFCGRNFWMRIAVAEAVMEMYFHLFNKKNGT